MTDSRLSDERLRSAFQALGDASSGECSEEELERIWQAVCGELPAAERRDLVDRMSADPAYAEAWRVARELAPVRAVTPAVSQGSSRWRWMSLAAAAVLAVGLGWQLFDGRQSVEPPAYRSADERRILSQLPAGASLPRAAPVLRWTSIEGARYKVRVLTPTLDVVEEATDLIIPEHRLSTEALSGLAPGSQLLWQVEATVPGAASVVSPTFSVRLE